MPSKKWSVVSQALGIINHSPRKLMEEVLKAGDREVCHGVKYVAIGPKTMTPANRTWLKSRKVYH